MSINAHSLFTTLILGGYGHFGSRISRALAEHGSIKLLIAGRDIRRAQALASSLGGMAQGIALDMHHPSLSHELQRLQVDLVIHTAGPFQQQGYHVAAAAAAAKCHYIDLADGRRFVCDFAQALDPAFRAAGCTGITGASTLPALSSAVVDYLCAGWQQINTLDICIAPAQSAPRGRATFEAVLSYCGKLLEVWTAGAWQQQLGWSELEKVSFARMAARRGALCDVPDLELFPCHYQVSERVMFKAALEVGIGQYALAWLARLHRQGMMPAPQRFAGLMNTLSPALDFLGTARGGMVVRASGIDASTQPITRSWHITADDDHGPEIPCMAAILLARKLADKSALPVGAHACMAWLKLHEFQPEFDRWRMVTDTIDETIMPDG